LLCPTEQCRPIRSGATSYPITVTDYDNGALFVKYVRGMLHGSFYFMGLSQLGEWDA
jgi:hypothetical protein